MDSVVVNRVGMYTYRMCREWEGSVSTINRGSYYFGGFTYIVWSWLLHAYTHFGRMFVWCGTVPTSSTHCSRGLSCEKVTKFSKSPCLQSLNTFCTCDRPKFRPICTTTTCLRLNRQGAPHQQLGPSKHLPSAARYSCISPYHKMITECDSVSLLWRTRYGIIRTSTTMRPWPRAPRGFHLWVKCVGNYIVCIPPLQSCVVIRLLNWWGLVSIDVARSICAWRYRLPGWTRKACPSLSSLVQSLLVSQPAGLTGWGNVCTPYYRMMNFDLAIVMYGDASFKHTLIKTRITVCLTRITACLKSVSRVFEIHVQLLFGAKDWQ